MAKMRLDALLVELGLSATIKESTAMIMLGKIMVNETKIDKPGTQVDVDSTIRILGETLPFVGRGGLKLKKALDVFRVVVENRVCLDVGASTGGFTDCLLQHGASMVYAIDVGYGQLNWRLRSDPRVIVLDRTNIRNLSVADLRAARHLHFINRDVPRLITQAGADRLDP